MDAKTDVKLYLGKNIGENRLAIWKNILICGEFWYRPKKV